MPQTQPALRIEYLPLASIARFDRNPKKHDVGALVQSIRRYGFRDAPIFDGTLKALVAGHGRLKALEAMQGDGDQAPPGVKVNGGGEWLVPLQLGVDAKSAAEARAFLVDHNALTVAGGDMGVEGILRMYDQDALGALLKEAAEAGEMPVTLDGDDLDQLLSGGPKATVEDDPSDLIDRSEALQQKWETKPGQLWTLGAHRVLCGDSTKAEDVERAMGAERALLMVTDPPYGVEYEPDWRNEAHRKGKIQYGARRLGKVEADDRFSWLPSWEAFTGDVAYVWHAGLRGSEVATDLMAAGFEIRGQMVWRKPFAPISRGHYHWQHEPCWYAVRKGKSASWAGDRKQTTVWDATSPNDPYQRAGEAYTNHGTQKPVECMARPIRNHGGKDDAVYDPFLGSGTTLIAAEQLGRRCYGLEIAPQYVAVTLQRWADATGKEPSLVS